MKRVSMRELSSSPYQLSQETNDEDSRVCFEPDTDDSQESSANKFSAKNPILEPSHRHSRGNSSSHLSSRAMGPQTSPDQNSCFGHNNNDEVDEDIANVPLDYGQSESTKALMRRIEFRILKFGATSLGGAYGNALQAALLDGDHEIVKLLLDKGADINAQGGEHGSALQAASSKGHHEIIKLLLG
ncbi:hypothetical protein N7476_003722 [Penicillium atrosanguineum]|uniref:Uncharacterized protein n=1 Tax=Penicillium atrosanguineum TaxID=1132637 RepID=A0A9W9PZD8_9EURO|nr:hypothetical protein N7476_003722 [Penicillium atrosanguineum]